MKVNEIVDYESALKYLRHVDAHPSEVGYTTANDEETGEKYNKPKRITKLCKQLAKRDLDIDPLVLASMLAKGNVDPSQFGDLIPNDVVGPLNIQQKEYIRDHLAHLPANDIATYVKTNHQNVRLAQKGQFTSYKGAATGRWTEDMPQPSTQGSEPMPINTTRPYGPLSLDEKLHIFDNCQHIKVQDLANVYNTSTTNVINAKQGKFKRPLDRPDNGMLLERLLQYSDSKWRIYCDEDLSIDIQLSEFIDKIIKGESI